MPHSKPSSKVSGTTTSTKRPRRDGKQRRAKQPDTGAKAPTVRFPVVGEVPLIRSADGTRWIYDPDHRPQLPPGAVAGDIRRQVFCCDLPYYAYVDVASTCVQCGAPFVFSAREQKYWYETLQFRLDSRAIRCVGCRRQRRSDQAVLRRHQAAAAHRDAEDAGRLIEFADALCDLIERLGRGKASDVVAAARRARRAEPGWADPLYWEGRGQQLAGRAAQADALFERFALEARGGRATRRLVEDARRRRSA